MLNMGEIVTLTKHDPEGRILEFVKTPIPLGTAEELKAAALVENERKKEVALLREAKALLALAKSTNAKLAATPVDDKSAALPIKSVPPAALPVPPVSRPVPPALAARGVKKLNPNELLNATIECAAFVRSVMKALAERDGSQIGKSIMAASLKPHEGCGAGTRAAANNNLDATVRNVLDQLQKQNALVVRTPESRAAFISAFRAGADAVLADFNERKKVVCA
jgi:hypothetical protein